MKRGALVVVVAVLVSAVAYCFYFYCATQPVQAMMNKPEAEMEWLRQEFNLNDSQFARIKALHGAYRPECDRMCQRISATNARVNSLIESNRSVTPEIKGALKQASDARQECREAMLAHIYAVSAEMSPESGRRYLLMMKPRLMQAGLPSNMAVSPAQLTPGDR